MLKRSPIWPVTSAMKLSGLGSLSNFYKAVYTAASKEKFVNSSKDPKTHNCASLVPFLIAGTVTAGSVQDGLLQDPYFWKKNGRVLWALGNK